MNRIEVAFSEWVRRTPDATAVEGPDGHFTYSELDRLANAMASTLHAAGVKRGERVGVHTPRSGRSIAAMIAALRLGAVYVPIDPGSPPARADRIVTDCQLRAVLIAPQLLNAWMAAEVGASVELYMLSNDAPLARAPRTGSVVPWSTLQATEAAQLPALSTPPDELAYILYTSGSTGLPKGVMSSHRNARAFLDWAADTVSLASGDRVASVAPFHFDLSVFDVWSSLSRGATIVIVGEVTVIDGRRMLDLIHTARIQVWYSVPSAWTLMLETGELERRGAPSLRAVYFAGEVFPLAQLARTMRAVPRARFLNLFGPTETNVCLAHEVLSPPAPEQGAIPIGHPVCGAQITIVDDAGQPVGDGAVGELLVEGPTVMLGYWNGGAPLVAKHPYPTGDMVSRSQGGDVMYHGRRDHMVKVHGYRIELGEVEAALLAHPSVREAIAFAHEQRLVAVVVPRDEALSVLDLKRHCAHILPRYMIPSDVRLVADLPRTSSGKTDRVRTRQAAVQRDASILTPLSAPTVRSL